MKLGGKFSEGDYQIQQTEFLLDSFGETINLLREPAYVDDDAGGVIRPDSGVDTSVGNQTFWFYESAPVAHIARGSNFQQTIGMGQKVTTNFILLGKPNANIKQDDTFVKGPHEYRVVFVHDDRSFQTIAELERIGSGES